MPPELSASWTTAGATILLALFAFLAWRASAKSLKSMQNQERDSKLSAQRQVDDQNWGRQVESLADYTSALADLIAIPGLMKVNDSPIASNDPRFFRHTTARGTDEVRNILARIQSTGLIWRMHHVRQMKLIWRLEALDDEVRILSSAAIEGRAEWEIAREAAGVLLDIAEAWQQKLNNRELEAIKAEKLHTELVNLRIKRDRDSRNAE